MNIFRGTSFHNFIPARVFQLAYPVMLGMMTQVILNIVDTAMVGRLGAASLAATGLGSMAFLVISLSFESLGTGTQILVSRRWGEKDLPETSRILFNSLALTLPIGVILTSLGIFEAGPYIGLLVRDREVQALAAIYVRIRFLSFFFFLVITSFRGYFDGIAKTRIRLEYMLIVVSLNIPLNYLLIFGKWGFPRLGVAGAALASALSVMVGAAYILICALKDDNLNNHPFFRRGNFRLPIARKIVYFSLPKGLRMFFTFSAFLVFLKIVGLIGVRELAASNILLSILSFSFMPGIGVGIAGATLVGQSLGAKNFRAARHYGWASARLGVLFMGLSGLSFIVFARPILSVFTPDPRVIRAGTRPLIILGAVQVFDALGVVLSQCLEGAGATHWVLKAELVIYWLFLLPLAYLLSVNLNWGLVGAWTSLGLTMIVYAALMVGKFRSGNWLNIRA